MEKKDKGVLVHLKPVVAAEETASKGVKELHKKKTKSEKVKIGIGIALILLLIGYAQVNVGVRTEMDINKIHNNEGANNNRFESFGSNYLRYGKDGMALVDKNMNEIWNIAYQIGNPILAKQGESLAIADRNGNQIIVANSDGSKGEIYTSLPIEKISISNQGVVLAQVKDEVSSQIVCYDSVGNLLLEHQVSVNNQGYPLDIALSYDGSKMMVTYVNYNEGIIESSYTCYSLNNPEATIEEKIVAERKVEGAILPTAFFADKSAAVVIGSDKIFFVDTNKPGAEPKEVLVEDEIASVVHEGDYLVIATKSNDGLNESRLLIYNKTGSFLGEANYEGSFTNIKIIGKTVLLYEGEKCKIFSVNGREIFDGEFSGEIVDIFPVSIFNKYLLIGKDDIVNVRLKR